MTEANRFVMCLAMALIFAVLAAADRWALAWIPLGVAGWLARNLSRGGR